jgi:hypothetical protein
MKSGSKRFGTAPGSGSDQVIGARSLPLPVPSVNHEIGKNAHKSKDAWVRIASSVQSRQEAH